MSIKRFKTLVDLIMTEARKDGEIVLSADLNSKSKLWGELKDDRGRYLVE